jgi:hypothetical protein
MRNARQARKLHLDIDLSGKSDACFELRACEKMSVRKKMFLGAPDDIHIGKDALYILRLWLAIRYRRQAIPDDLDQCLKPLWEKFRKPAEEISRALHGIRIQFARNEDPDDHAVSYDCTLFFVYDADHKESSQVRQVIETLLPITGDLASTTLPVYLELLPVPDTVFTYQMQRRSTRWVHDHISVKSNSQLDDV